MTHLFAKSMVVIIAFTAIAVSALLLRQARFDAMHDMMRQHREINRSRQTLWDLQTRIAERAQPAQVREAIREAGLEMTPVLVEPGSPTPIDRYVFLDG